MKVTEWLKNSKMIDVEISTLQGIKANTLNGRRGGSQPARQFITLLDKQINKDTAYKNAVVDAINSVDNSVYKQILTEKYINGYTFEEIADLMYFSGAYVQKLHKKAISEIELRGVLQ